VERTKFCEGDISSAASKVEPSGERKISLLIDWCVDVLYSSGRSSYGNLLYKCYTRFRLFSEAKAYNSKYYFKVSYFLSAMVRGVFDFSISCNLMASNFS
jgi:hypothetical protein